MWKTRRILRPSLIPSLLVGFAALLASNPASAEQCRVVPTVVASASVATNTNHGGHLTQHIEGTRPPPGTSQVGKTLFEAPGKFDTVWKAYTRTNRISPVNCVGRQAQQEVFLQDLGIRFLGAFSCKAAAPDGRCTKGDSYMAKSVFFGFIWRDGKWILNTAFPVPVP
jgi:hypothetical protein